MHEDFGNRRHVDFAARLGVVVRNGPAAFVDVDLYGRWEMKIIVIRDFNRPYLGGNLNVRQLLNPLFFAPVTRHPDSTRQRGARQRDKDLAAARRLKAQYVPLCFVDRSCYIHNFDHDHVRGYWGIREVRNA